MSQCEDHPCCGHTPDDPCTPQWYDAPDAFDTSVYPHALCDHENGFCDVWEDEDEDEDDQPTDADYIRWEQEAQLSAIEDHYGIEPRGWEDSY